ncbi:MAG: oligosaccharide flippase family protein [bacterium]
MNHFIQQLKTSTVVRNSAILFIGTMIFNILNYVYHLVMSRMLSTNDFGELESLFALIYLLVVPATALMTVAMRFSSIYKAENNLAKTRLFLKKFNQYLIFISLLIILSALIFGSLIAGFLKLENRQPVVLLGLFMAFYLFALLGQGVLQGWQKFSSVSVALVVQGVLKVGLAILFVWLAWGVSGAIGGVMAAALAFFLMIIYFQKRLFRQNDENKATRIEYQEIWRYCWPVFFTLLAITALYNVDMMLVKHFFDAETAGNYGALAILGKIIFFATAPLISVMFPMVAESHRLRGDYQKVLKQSLGLVLVVGLSPVILYFCWPKLIIALLVGSKFLAMAPYLGWLGLAIFFVSLINFLANFFLSIQKRKFIYFIILGVLALVVLMSVYHRTLWQVMGVMNGVMAGIFLLLLGYFFKSAGGRKKSA